MIASRNQSAERGCQRHTQAAKPGRIPDIRRQLADHREAMPRHRHHPAPRNLHLRILQRRIELHHVPLQKRRNPRRRRLPRPARDHPKEPACRPADDNSSSPSGYRKSHTARGSRRADHAERLRRHDEGCNRDGRPRQRPFQPVDIAAAGDDNTFGTDASTCGTHLMPVGACGNPSRPSFLKDLSTAFHTGPRKTEIKVQRMHRHRGRHKQRVRIPLRRQCLPHPLARPVLELDPEILRHEVAEFRQIIAMPGNIAAKRALLVRPAVDRVFGNALPHQTKPELRHLLYFPRALRPTRFTSNSYPFGKPSEAKPPLRPDAPQPIRLASISATERPRSARSSAVAQPARPAADDQRLHLQIPISDGYWLRSDSVRA